VIAMCGWVGSPLAQLTRLHNMNAPCEFEITTGSDGFLATVSLITFCALLLKAYQAAFNTGWTFPAAPQFFESLNTIERAASPEFLAKQSWLILYGPYSFPIALDAESKLTESTLVSSRIIDYRNFSHGHYHWLANHPETTGVLALMTPEETNLAELTLSQLPAGTAIQKLATKFKGPVGSLWLMTAFIALVDALGKSRNWNPQQMATADFGKQLQSTAYSFNA
jgi:hypothetical protein